MEDTNWVLGDIIWAFLGVAVILGLMMLNAYVQKLNRIEDERRIARMASNPSIPLEAIVTSTSQPSGKERLTCLRAMAESSQINKGMDMKLPSRTPD